MTGTVGAFLGDGGLGDAALAEAAAMDGLEGALDFGAPTAREIAAKIAASSANLRSGPGLVYDKVGKLASGTQVTALERSAEWLHVRTPAGTQGWIAQEVLDIQADLVARIPVANNVPARPAALQATTNNSAVNLRQGPGTHYPSLGKLTRGTKLELLGRQGSWYEVQTRAGKVGWVSSDFLQIPAGVAARVPAGNATQTGAASVPSGTVSEGRTHLRRGPGTSYESLGQLGVRTQVTLVARHGDWFKVRTARGTTGWVLGEMLDVSARVARSVPVTNDVPAAPRAAADEIQTFTGKSAASRRGAVAARVARRYVGSRYRWGGASPRGFDCSGLVVYAYRQAGLRLPHKASALYSTRYGTRIRSIGALQPGDIVAFAGTAGRKRGITHVAIYVGGGRMVTANSPRMGVRLASIHTRYWRSHFVGAIRPR